MKKYFALLFVTVFAASAIAAPALNPKLLSRTQTVNDIKKISFPYKPIPVTAQPASGSTDTTTSTYTPSNRYSTGSGAVLTPANLFDGDILSNLAFWYVEYNNTAHSEINDASAPFVTITIPPKQSPVTLFSTIVFGKLAKETRTYVLTLKMDNTTNSGYFRIRIGDTSFEPAQVLYNPSTKEYRVLFSFAPPQSQMNILVYYISTNQTSDARIKFYYAQLTRLD
jgi:hypothetical protein